MTRPVIVLGAGPAGIGAATALGKDATVLERGRLPAGLSQTIVLDGAVFDLGGHSFHTPHPLVRDLVFGAVEMEEQRRNAWCSVQGEWIAYPFQKHVADLRDPELRAACLRGMAQAGDGRGARNFDDYIDDRFGPAVAATFMRPYNQKLWGDDLSRLTADWTIERIAGTPGEPEKFVDHGGRRTPLQAETTIAYPARGGFGTIFEALATRLDDLRLDTEVVRIDRDRKTLTTRAGDTLPWQRLVSTLPLPGLLAVLDDVPVAISDAVALLEPIAVDLVMIVLKGRGPIDRQRVYCADPDMPGHKIVMNHTSSQWLRDLPRHGIQVEVSCAGGRHPAGLLDVVIDKLARIGLIAGSDDVLRGEVLHLPYGYPAPTHERNRSVRAVREWLADSDIDICGRFAEWAYVNADEALARGLVLGQSLTSDSRR